MAQYLTLLTNTGAAKLATALANGTTVQITQLAVGDGNGAAVTPTATMTALVRERHRVTLQSLTVDSSNPNYIIAEGVIPSTVGGWTIREAALFDSAGQMFAVANFPDTVKPLLAEGSARDLVVRIVIQVSNTSAVQLLIDPSVVLASQSWVNSQGFVKKAGDIMTGLLTLSGNPTANLHAVPKQFLDTSLANYLLKSGGSMTGNLSMTNGAFLKLERVNTTNEGGEVQFMRAGDNTVAWVIDQTGAGTTSPGLLRFHNNTGENPRLSLSSTDATFTVPVTLPGDPTTSFQAATKNYVDSRTGSDAVPIGQILWYAGQTAPTSFLICDGSAVSRTTYSVLFARIGTTYGAGDGSTTFNLPDLRGEFIRGWDSRASGGPDSGRVFGSKQTATGLGHIGTDANNNQLAMNVDQPDGTNESYTFNGRLDSGIASSATQKRWRVRPRNIALLPIIKAALLSPVDVALLGQAQAQYVAKIGDTMTGALTLSGAPTSSLHAATKAYVDTADAAKLNLTGGTLTGALTLAGAPASALQAATKQYVDDATAAATSNGQVEAWVNFNGTGTVAIRASANISSITDNGVGQYTINFATPLPDANYSFALSGAQPAGSSSTGVIARHTVDPTASALVIVCYNNSNATDFATVTATIVR